MNFFPRTKTIPAPPLSTLEAEMAKLRKSLEQDFVRNGRCLMTASRFRVWG